MIIHDVEQGTEEWHASRIGVITASCFKLARSRYKTGAKKGRFTEAALDYAFSKAVERVGAQYLNDSFDTYSMKRGRELEPMARLEHELMLDVIVDEVGLITSDNGLFGASADGIIKKEHNNIDNEIGCEYKCFTSPEKVRKFWVDDDIGDVYEQIQGGMWITGLNLWHVGMYCPALEVCGKSLWLKEYERDDKYIAELEADLLEFNETVKIFEEKLRG